MVNELGPDDEHNIFNPFYSEEVKQPLDADWQAKRVLANEIRQLIEGLVTTGSNAEVLLAAAKAVAEQSEKLKQAPRYLGRTAFYEAEPEKYKTFAALGYELNPVDG